MSNAHQSWWKERCKKESTTHHVWTGHFNPDTSTNEWAKTAANYTMPTMSYRPPERLSQTELSEREKAVRWREAEIARREVILRQSRKMMDAQQKRYVYMGSNWGTSPIGQSHSLRSGLPPAAHMASTPSLRAPSRATGSLRRSPSKKPSKNKSRRSMSRSMSAATLQRSVPRGNAGPGYHEFAEYPGQSTFNRAPRIQDVAPNLSAQSNPLQASLPSYFNSVHDRAKKAICL